METYLIILMNLFLFALLGWLFSLYSGKVTHVDSMWSLFFLLAFLTGFCSIENPSSVHLATLTALFLWSTRLSIYLTTRNWNKSEDIRYQNIRRNNEPNFKWKSLYIIFLFQALLALIISMPLISIINNPDNYNFFTQLGLGLFLIGFSIEIVADRQLRNFLKKRSSQDVLNSGLLKYSRHPNYFGECVIWWGFYIISIPDGNLLNLFSPILMTYLLVKISGADLMESTIKQRRPSYEKYIKTTSKFIPWPPKK